MLKMGLEYFIDELKLFSEETDFVKSFILYGSSALEIQKPSSDIDLIFFISNNSKESISVLSEKIFSEYIKNSPISVPSVNVWTTENKDVLPYYKSCILLGNIKVLYDDNFFNPILEQSKKECMDGSYTMRYESNINFWIAKKISLESVQLIGNSYYKKFSQMKKYAFMAHNQKDFSTAIEFTHKAAYYLLFSYVENSGFHMKNQRHMMTLRNNIVDDSFNDFLKSKFKLEILKKRLLPFDTLGNEDLSLSSLDLLKKMEVVYNSKYNN